MEYSPIKFAGEIFQEIFSEIIFKSEVFSKPLVRIIDDVKNEKTVTTLAGEIPLQAYKSRLAQDGTDASDTLKFSDAIIKPNKLMAYTEFDMEQLRSTRFGRDMQKGAANITSNEFEQAVLNFAIPRISTSYEKAFWSGVTPATKAATADVNNTTPTANQKTLIASLSVNDQVDGVIARLVSSGVVTSVAGTTLTSANLKAEFKKLYAAASAEVVNSEDSNMYVSYKVRQLIMQANNDATYRDIFTVVSKDEIYYLGKKVEFVHLPDNVMIFAVWSDLIAGMDLLADSTMGNLEVAKLHANSDILFLKGVMSLDVAVTLPQQVVLYC